MFSSLTMAMVLRNEEQNLPRLLSSIEREVLDQCDASLLHFIFVDNQSIDQTRKLVENFVEKHESVRSQIFRRDQNNLAEARNQCWRECQTNWIVFIDGDTSLQPGWLAGVQSSLQNCEEVVGVIGGASQYVVLKPWHRAVCRLDECFPWGRSANQIRAVNHVPTNNCLIRIKTLFAVNGFDSRFNRVGEDLDLMVRVQRSGAQILYDPGFAVEHIPPVSETGWYQKMFRYGQAQSRVMLKNGRGIPLLKFLPLIFVILAFVAMLNSQWFLLSFGLALLVRRLRIYLLSLISYGMGEIRGFLSF